MIRRHSLVLAAALIVLCAISCSANTIYVKWDSPGPTFDGTSWDTAFHTVQAGLNAATSGDEIWVAKGTYVERITLKRGVGLYGGFAGGETARSQRDFRANETILDGNDTGTVVTSQSSDTNTTVIDGFTIRHGKSSSDGGGIYCSASSPTIRNNTITANNAARKGGGMFCVFSSPTVTGNTFTGNSATDGAGMYCACYSPFIMNNTITGNRATYYGGGISCSSASAIITNNTITANHGDGICCSGSQPTVTNNVITGNSGSGVRACDSSPRIMGNMIIGNSAYNGGGIYCWGQSSPVITNNTVVGNGALDGGGIYCSTSSPTVSNNIVAFNSSGIYNSGGVPSLRNNCVYGNAGYSYFGISAGTGDMSLDPLLASHAYGNAHVQPGSPCLNAGLNDAISLPLTDVDGQPRIQDGTVDIGADESNGMVWSPGPYAIIRVSSSGDDANDGSSWSLAKKTVQAGIDAALAHGGEVWVAAGSYSERIVLHSFTYLYGGFTGTESSRSQRDWTANTTALDGGAGGSVVTADVGYNVSAIDGFTVRNGYAHYGGGVYCRYSSPIIANNILASNSGNIGGGICCDCSSPTITSNTITGNIDGGGISCIYSSPTIRGNRITDNAFGRGIACISSSPTIANNRIAGHPNGGIHCQNSSSPTITNNTITGNSALYNNGAVSCDSSSPVVSNNVVAFNSAGISRIGGAPLLSSNCVYGNTSYNYFSLSAGTGDISIDPLFVDRTNGDYHLSASSPCINAGSNDAPGLPLFDMDGQGRIFGRKADIGADEYWSPTMSVPDARYAANGVKISGQDAVVSAAFDGCFYIEAEDRSCGIRVSKAAHGIQAGDKVTITGTLKTNTDGERYIEASSVEETGTGSIAPVHIISRALGGGNWFYNPTTGAGQCGVVGGFGLNNIGLLVRTWGKISYLDGAYALDLGSDKTAKILAEGMSIGGKATYVQITGISSCYRDASGLHPTLLVTDVTPVQ